MASPEYLDVLSQVVERLRLALADNRLPDLTPEQMQHWFRSVAVEDIRRVSTETSARSAASNAA